MLIYLRHGDDRGDDEYRHDRRLNDRGRKKAVKKAAKLIKAHGHPDHVFVSPFRRTIETLECMANHFERHVEVHHDPRIAQHLSTKQRAAPSVSPKVLAMIDANESEEAFRRRVAAHAQDARQRAAEGAVWCISHQVVVEEIARIFGAKIASDLDFLDHVVVLR